MRKMIVAALMLMPIQGWAATDFIAPGTPSSVGQNGAVLGPVPDHPVPAPRGALQTLGLPTNAADRAAARLSRDDARRRIEEAGYRRVSGLTQDKAGVWRGRAEKGGRTMPVNCNGLGDVSEG